MLSSYAHFLLCDMGLGPPIPCFTGLLSSHEIIDHAETFYSVKFSPVVSSCFYCGCGWDGWGKAYQGFQQENECHCVCQLD